MPDEVKIRAYSTSDEQALVALFGRCFGREISQGHWQWKFLSAEAEYANVWVATRGEQIVGQYAGIPYEAWVEGEPRPVIDIVDAMVDPTMRRQGVLVRMGSRAHECWRNAGVYFGYGLPNQQWVSSASTLGWEYLFPLCWMIRVLRPEQILATRIGLTGISRLRAIGTLARSLFGCPRRDPTVVTSILGTSTAALDQIATSAIPRKKITLVRGANFVARRYLRCPSADYQVVVAFRDDKPIAYAVYKIRGNTACQGVLVELIAPPDDYGVRLTLLYDIEDRCLAAGAQSLLTLAVPDTDDYRLLRKCGYFRRRAAFGAQFVPFESRMRRMIAKENWQNIAGDYDVV
jgi:hypothetical protein